MVHIICTFLVSMFVFQAKATFLETKCNNQDCFTWGWTTTSPDSDYYLQAQCKENDCQNLGWQSLDNRSSEYNVKCKVGGCFVKGWVSVERAEKGALRIDIVNCKNDDCLTYGWTIKNGFSEGDVTCKNENCREFGGFSFWRGLHSETTCINSSCYSNGWTANIED